VTAAIGRRAVFGWTGAALAVGAGGGTLVAARRDSDPPPPAPGLPETVEFHGIHQAGIATPAPGHLLLTAYDVPATASKATIAKLFRAWTAAARAITQGTKVPADPTIAVDGQPAALTVTIGIGRELLGRLGLEVPAALADLPQFAGDVIEERFSGGDLVVQLCGDDPMVLAGADRVLRRSAGAVVRPRWQQAGFQGMAARRDGHSTRNLMGQVDGTNNVSTSDKARGGPVWVDAAEPAWMTGGSYLVVRRIRMLLDSWETLAVPAQERVIGRHKLSGAPLGSQEEADPVDLDAKGTDGSPLIPVNSHVRLSTPAKGEEMLRRGFSYRAGVLPDGSSDEGLLFLAYVKDPRTSFVPVQKRLAAHDALNEFTRTTGSALFAMLPGVQNINDWYGKSLLT
jgi:dye decolorizing peroxidase